MEKPLTHVGGFFVPQIYDVVERRRHYGKNFFIHSTICEYRNVDVLLMDDIQFTIGKTHIMYLVDRL